MRSELLSSPEPRMLTAEEYLHAKLDYEATPHGLMSELERAPDKILVLDVRDAAAFAKSHIPGAQSIPEKELKTKSAGLPKAKRIVCYGWDSDCVLAPTAALGLARRGFKVQFLAGGFAEWIRRDLPVEKRVETRKH
jgi:rhodanese-related sulfurtransferase